MATVRDILTGSLRILGVLAAGETMTAQDAQDALETYNATLAQLSAGGVFSGFSAQGIDDDCFLDEKHHDAVKCMVAVNLSPLFGVEPSPFVVSRAMKGKNMIYADFAAPQEIKPDGALLYMSSQRRSW